MRGVGQVAACQASGASGCGACALVSTVSDGREEINNVSLVRVSGILAILENIIGLGWWGLSKLYRAPRSD